MSHSLELLRAVSGYQNTDLLPFQTASKKRRIFGTYAFETSNGVLLMIMGLFPFIPVIIPSRFCLATTNSLANGCTQPIWQSKVAEGVQGRVFSARRMLSYSIIPLAYLVAGPLSERVFQPAMAEGGWLANRIGHLIGVGTAHAIGLQVALGGLLYVIATSFILILPRVRRMELELPDAIREEPEREVAEAL